jgi:hypothetical protein
MKQAMTKTAVVAQKVHAQLLSIISAQGMLRLGGLVEYERLAVVQVLGKMIVIHNHCCKPMQAAQHCPGLAIWASSWRSCPQVNGLTCRVHPVRKSR